MKFIKKYIIIIMIIMNITWEILFTKYKCMEPVCIQQKVHPYIHVLQIKLCIILYTVKIKVLISYTQLHIIIIIQYIHKWHKHSTYV